MGFISIPLGFLLVGVIPALLSCTISYSLYRESQSRILSYPGFFLGIFGVFHFLLIFIFTLYSGFLYASEDPLQMRWKGVYLGSFSVKTPEGNLINSDQFSNKKLVVTHWASWCAPCVSEIPSLNLLNKNSNIKVIGISSESMATISKAREKYAIQYPVGKLSRPAKAFLEVIGLPTIFFIDRNGVIQHVKVGFQDYKYLKDLALEDAFTGEARMTPKELFDGANIILSWWLKLFDLIGVKI